MADSKIEQYLIDMMFTYQQVDDNLWLLDDEDRALQGVAVMQADPLVILRAEIMDVPQKNLLELYTTLLELNATDLVHGAYALDKDNKKVVLVDSLLFNSMDFEEFRASLDSFSLALTQHYPILSKYRENRHKNAAGD
jgi:hypothetical protein